MLEIDEVRCVHLFRRHWRLGRILAGPAGRHPILIWTRLLRFAVLGSIGKQQRQRHACGGAVRGWPRST